MKARQGFLFGDVGSEYCFFVGIDVLVCNDDDKCRVAQMALLNGLLKSPLGEVSIDDIVRDLTMPFDDGGKWIGPAIKQLQDEGIICPQVPRRSKRKPRKGGLVNVWSLGDRRKADTRVEWLRSTLTFTKTIEGSEGLVSKPS